MFDILGPDWLFSAEGAVVVLAMSKLIEGDCPKCSSKLKKLDDNTYFCESCKTKFKAE